VVDALKALGALLLAGILVVLLLVLWGFLTAIAYAGVIIMAIVGLASVIYWWIRLWFTKGNKG
jgi:amino acid permease